jgi:hypothetical protein
MGDRDWKTIYELYMYSVRRPLDINEHMPFLAGLAYSHPIIVEFGFRSGRSTCSFLVGEAEKVYSYDIAPCTLDVRLIKSMPGVGDRLIFTQQDSREADIPQCDLLFIDSDHTDTVIEVELEKHCNKVRKTIAMHDTIAYGPKHPDGTGGLTAAIDAFLRKHSEWKRVIHFPHNHGLMVLRRMDA